MMLDPLFSGKSMRTHLTALCALGAALVSACGGGSDSAVPPGGPAAPPPPASAPPSAPPPPASAPPAVSQLDAAALRLYESAAVHATLATSHHYYMAYDDQVWSWDCVQLSLDGAPAPPVLPTGSHTFAASFDRCYVDLLVGTWLNGTASSAYTATDLNDLTAQVSVNSMRGKLVAFRSDLYDVTADGSGTWTRLRTGTPWTTSWAETTTYRPTIGSMLTNNLTTNVATFGGGSYTNSWGPPPPGAAASGRQQFNDLAIAISGTSYTLNGSLYSVYGFSGGQGSHTGEVRITSNGTLVARIYGDVNGALRTEVLSPLVPL